MLGHTVFSFGELIATIPHSYAPLYPGSYRRYCAIVGAVFVPLLLYDQTERVSDIALEPG
jgi:hypothetical protein